jgi:hypothetical protein
MGTRVLPVSRTYVARNSKAESSLGNRPAVEGVHSLLFCKALQSAQSLIPRVAMDVPNPAREGLQTVNLAWLKTALLEELPLLSDPRPEPESVASRE